MPANGGQELALAEALRDEANDLLNMIIELATITVSPGGTLEGGLESDTPSW